MALLSPDPWDYLVVVHGQYPKKVIEIVDLHEHKDKASALFETSFHV
jgi:hypothetical protein